MEEGQEMYEIVQDHERRLTTVEERVHKLEENQLEMKNGFLRVENTVLQEGKEQKHLLNKLMDHFFEERKDNRSNKVKLSEVRWTTIAGLLGGGGAVAVFTQWVLTKI